jgi:hypothetical protein
MFKNWFAQGIATNIVSAAIIGAGGIMVTLLAKNASAWAIPVLCGLGASALTSVILAALRALGPRSRRTIKPSNAKEAIRECLDKASIAVQNSPLDGWIFNYIATLNDRRIAIGQMKADPGYLHFSSSITFTEEDNRVIEASQAGGAGTTKALRIGLSAAKIGYSGIEFPFKQVTINKRMFMGERFGEYEFTQVLFEVEAAFVLAMEIATIPRDQSVKQIAE